MAESAILKDGLGFQQAAEKYPAFPRTVLRKLDTALRGVLISPAALDRARQEGAVYEPAPEEGAPPGKPSLRGAFFSDATLFRDIEVDEQAFARRIKQGSPYTLDLVEGKTWLVDGGVPVEQAFFSPLPSYYGKRTQRGTLLEKVVGAGPANCLNLNILSYCNSWKEHLPCKYCDYPPSFRSKGSFTKEGWLTQEGLDDIAEAVAMALQEVGHFTCMRIQSGSDPHGERPFENEVAQYVRVLETLQGVFGTPKVPARLVASAFPKDQSARVAKAGASGYEPHLEVWDPQAFEWVCPAKARYFGRDYWIQSAVDAVESFGRGNVCTQFVAGAELAGPHGLPTPEAALESTLEGAEYFAQRGVVPVSIVLWVGRGSIFFRDKQTAPPLEYYVRLAQGFRDIRRRHCLASDINDYRSCAVHPEADLGRLDAHRAVNGKPGEVPCPH